MNVRAKFRVDSVTGDGDQRQVEMSAVTGKENEPWSKYTPCGQFRMTITNPGAFEQFTAGQVVHIDITEAPKDE